MTKQPTPHVSDEDVQRIVNRDFDQEEIEEVLSLLNEYGVEEWHREIARVQLAALKFANGSMNRLRSELEIAKSDFRDTLAKAEYPRFLKHGTKDFPETSKQKLIESDWNEYQAWLNYPAPR